MSSFVTNALTHALATDLLISLIRCKSLTPHDGGCLDAIKNYLTPLGFICERFDQNGVSNAFFKLARGKTHLCFAGHTDVVPTLDDSLWTHSPFQGVVENERIYGRGAVDMKGAIAAFLSVLPEIIESTNHTLSLLLTSDEEGDATHGSQIIVRELVGRGEHIDLCIVGEPTSEKIVGDILKWGRRGSLSFNVLCTGQGGHVAYPHKAKNPIPNMLRFLEKIYSRRLDHGCDGFDASNLEITSIDVGNNTSNVIPEKISAKGNIRFNPLHTADALMGWLLDEAKIHGVEITFLSPNHPFYGASQEIAAALSASIGSKLSTSGGTSDARFIKELCPVIEVGLKNETAHHVDEHVSIEDLNSLGKIYLSLFRDFSNTNKNS